MLFSNNEIFYLRGKQFTTMIFDQFLFIQGKDILYVTFSVCLSIRGINNLQGNLDNRIFYSKSRHFT